MKKVILGTAGHIDHGKSSVVKALTGIDPDRLKEEKERGYWRKEIRKGSFERMIRLPLPVKENAVEAVYEKGILKISMPKAESKPSSKVKIKVKEK